MINEIGKDCGRYWIDNNVYDKKYPPGKEWSRRDNAVATPSTSFESHCHVLLPRVTVTKQTFPPAWMPNSPFHRRLTKSILPQHVRLYEREAWKCDNNGREWRTECSRHKRAIDNLRFGNSLDSGQRGESSFSTSSGKLIPPNSRYRSAIYFVRIISDGWQMATVEEKRENKRQDKKKKKKTNKVRTYRVEGKDDFYTFDLM